MPGVVGVGRDQLSDVLELGFDLKGEDGLGVRVREGSMRIRICALWVQTEYCYDGDVCYSVSRKGGYHVDKKGTT